ncbi:MAG: hypothetical protein LCH84_18170 [Gemmatimonadetes bacterium]|nr:hypothetical protein [Gemmatimonadota bacterium]
MARIAQLGVVIDSSGAKKGAQETNAALDSIGTSAKRSAQTRIEAEQAVARATTTSGAAFDAQVKAMQAAQREANRLANEERRLAQSQLEAAAAARALTGATTTQTTATAAQAVRAHAVAVGELRTSLSRTEGTIAGAAAGVGALTTGTTVATGATAGLTGALATLSGPVGTATIIALQAIPLAMQAIQRSTAQATLDIVAQRKAYADLSPAALEAARAAEMAYQARIRSTPMSYRARANAIGESDGRLAVIDRTIGAQQTSAAREYDRALQGLQASAEDSAEALRLFTLSGEKNADTFRRAAGVWVDLTGKSRSFARALHEFDPAAIALARAADVVVTNDNAIKDAASAAAKATRDQSQAAKDAAKELERQAKIMGELFDAKKKYAEQLATYGEREDEQARREIERSAERRAAAVATAEEMIRTAEQTLKLQGKTQEQADALTISWQKAAMSARLANEGLDKLTADKYAAQWAELATQAAANARAAREWEAALSRVGEAAAGVAEMVSAAGQLAGAFGDVGSAIDRALGGASRLLSSLSQVQRAGIFRDANGVTQNVGIGGALSGAAGIGGQAAAVAGIAGALGAGVGIITGFMQQMQGAAEAARQAANALREMRASVKRDVASYTLGASGTSLDQQLAALAADYNGLITNLLEAGAPRVPRLGARTAKNVVPTADDVNAVIDAYEQLVAAAKAAAEEAKRFAGLELNARGAAAAGRTAEAEAIRSQIARERELSEARKAGADAAMLAAIAEVQAAEAAAQERARMRERDAFAGDLTARGQAIRGDARGAFVTRQGLGAASALAEAEALVQAGTITAEMFEQLKQIIGVEMAQALYAFDQAAEQARKAQQDDLAVRELVALGYGKEAEQLRRTIANQNELAGVTDPLLRAQILYVQGLEAEAAAKAEANASAQRVAEQLLSIEERRARAFETLNPAMAEEIRANLRQAQRIKELNEAENEAIKNQLLALYALEDQAAAQLAAMEAAEAYTKALQAQADAQQKLADFGSSIEERWLRATGRTFDADQLALKRRRDEDLASLAGLIGQSLGTAPVVNPLDGASLAAFNAWLQQYQQLQAQYQDLAGKIEGTCGAELNALIAQRLGSSAPAVDVAAGVRVSADAPRILGEDTTAFRSSRSITESTSMQLVDYAASQLAVQRRILAVLERRGGSGATMAPSVDVLDRAFGVRVNDRARLVHGTVL